MLDGQSIDPVIEFIQKKGLHLRHLVEKRQSLEDLFLATHEDQAHVKRYSPGREAAPEVVTAIEADEEDRRS